VTVAWLAACLSGSGPIYKISYDLSKDYLKVIVGSTYGSDLQRAKLFPGNIAR